VTQALILATQEAKIRRITVQDEHRKKFVRPPSQPKGWALVLCICHPSYWKGINRRTVVQADLDIKQNPILKVTNAKGWWSDLSGRAPA
jgi:hypothetical protein